MKYLTLKDQLMQEREKNAALGAAQAQDAANIEYIAMMCDVELEEDAPADANVEEEV